MNLRNKKTGDQYFIDLFEKWWHFPLHGLTWFLPHNAYLLKNKNYSKPYKFKYSLGMGISAGLSFILGDLIRKINFVKVPTEYYWVGKVFAYPLIIVLIILTWKYLIYQLRIRNRVDFEKSYKVQLSILSINTISKCSFRLLVSFILILFLSETIKFDFIGMILMLIISCIFIITFTIGVGIDVPVLSTEGSELKPD